MEQYHQLQWRERIKIETLLQKGDGDMQIAQILGVSRQTIWREKQRGMYEHLNSDYTTEMRYSADLAQRKYEENLKNRGTQLKIGNDIHLAEYLERKIVEECYSPEAVVNEMHLTGKDKEFSVSICTKTFYSYIDKGVFLQLTNKDLPVKGKRKRRYHKVRCCQKKDQAGESIESRPESVEGREEFGHWEMDSVVGPRRKSKCSLLVLTERKTRNEIIMKLPDHTAASVVKALDALELSWGAMFPRVFKTITVDNGVEFSDAEGMQRSVLQGRRTQVYYCHPYSSWERGSNENLNRMIRRLIPKGVNFDNRPQEEIKEIERWMNHYPRRIHDFRSAAELFDLEIKKIA